MKRLLNSISYFIKNNPKIFLALIVIVLFSFNIFGKDGNLPLVLFAVVTLLALVISFYSAGRQKEPVLMKLSRIKREPSNNSNSGVIEGVSQKIIFNIPPLLIRVISVFLLVSLLATAFLFVPDARIKLALLIGALATIPVILMNPDTWHRRVAFFLILLVNATQLVFVISGQTSFHRLLPFNNPPEVISRENPSETDPNITGNADGDGEQYVRGTIRAKAEAVPPPVIIPVFTLIAAIIIFVIGERYRNS